MKTRAELLAWKRQRLIAACIVQRSDLAMQLHSLTHTLESIETGVRIADRVRRHPEWIAGIAIGLAVITPRRLSSMFRTGAALLRTWRSASPALEMLMRR